MSMYNLIEYSNQEVYGNTIEMNCYRDEIL